MLLATAVVLVMAETPPLVGPYATKHTTIRISGLKPTSDVVDVWYASDAPSKQRLIVFGHGYARGGENLPEYYGNICPDMAAWGFVVAAPRSCFNAAFCGGLFGGQDFYKQLNIVIQYALDRQELGLLKCVFVCRVACVCLRMAVIRACLLHWCVVRTLRN